MAIMEMAVIDLTGDTKVTWDPTKAAEVDNARRTFNDLRGRGYTAHATAGKRGGKTGAVMREFDPNASSVVMVPVMVAG